MVTYGTHCMNSFSVFFFFSANLYEFADLLVRKGVVNAINLDGGGSTTFVQDDLLMNYPSDHWLVAAGW